MTVYRLIHRRHIEYKLHTGEPVTDDRIIGFYSSREAAEAVCDVLRMKNGFSDSPEGFAVDAYEIAGEGNSVYRVEHSYYVEDDRMDAVVEIGHFATATEAEQAAAEYRRTSKVPVLSDIRDEDFNIDNYIAVTEYEIGDTCYSDGF